MNIDAGALGVAQELVAQADAAVRAFQQTGNLHHHEVLAAVGDDAQHRLNGGERVIGNLGPGGGTAGNQR